MEDGIVSCTVQLRSLLERATYTSYGGPGEGGPIVGNMGKSCWCVRVCEKFDARFSRQESTPKNFEDYQRL